MMLMRQAARERERLAELGKNRLVTLAGVASELVDTAGNENANALKILVVPNTSDRTGTNEVSANLLYRLIGTSYMRRHLIPFRELVTIIFCANFSI